MLTKSDFLKYTQCYKYLWLHKYRKDLIPKDISASLQRTFDEGYLKKQGIKKFGSSRKKYTCI
jgi:hypothetical protein